MGYYISRFKISPSCAHRRLWQHVTKSLKEGNIDEATEHKHRLEERQRGDERQRAADNKPWTPKYFSKEVQCRGMNCNCDVMMVVRKLIKKSSSPQCHFNLMDS